MSEEITQITKEFVALAKKPVLAPVENERARQLMCQLKTLGISNLEIAKLSNGKWSVSTVKGYTTGIAAPSNSPWKDAVATLTDLITTNLSLDDVKDALAIDHTLAANKLTLENVVWFLQVVTAADLDLAHLVDEIKALQQSGLSLQAAVGVAATKAKMEECGLTLEALSALLKIAQQYGPLPQVLEAFSVYASLMALETEVIAAQKEFEKTHGEIAAAIQQLEQIETKSQQLEAPIKAYQQVVAYGFTEKVLLEVYQLANNLGGIKVVVQALKKYTSLEEIKSEYSEARNKLFEYGSRINEAASKHSHLLSAIKMCETLIADHQYGLDAIGTILEVARKFGEPVAVLKAIETYGKMLSLENRAGELAGTVAEREKLLAALEAEYKEGLEKLDGLYAKVLELANKSGRLEGEFGASENLQRLLTIIQNPEGATFGEHCQIVLMLAVSLKRWVKSHHEGFKWSTENIETGLKRLIEEMGGTVL